MDQTTQPPSAHLHTSRQPSERTTAIGLSASETADERIGDAVAHGPVGEEPTGAVLISTEAPCDRGQSVEGSTS
jgi:hypothetical protein